MTKLEKKIHDLEIQANPGRKMIVVTQDQDDRSLWHYEGRTLTSLEFDQLKTSLDDYTDVLTVVYDQSPK